MTLARSLFMAAIAGLLSGALPAARASRADILNALRTE
jgi:ABC-type antimicrobial peptide transport system permease subunit